MNVDWFGLGVMTALFLTLTLCMRLSRGGIEDDKEEEDEDL